MTEETILLIGTSRAASEAASALTSESWAVTTVDGLSEAMPEIESRRHQVALLDTESVAEPPWEALELIRERDPHAAVLLMVTPETPWSSFSSYRQRPAGLVLKPLDRTALLMAVDSALVYRRLLEENRSLKRQLGSAVSLSDWVGCTPESMEIRKSIATAALATGTVLLLGEDGTGRRLAAELLHRHGRNPGTTFLPVDLVSLPAGEIHRLVDEVLEAADTGRGAYVHGARPGTLYLAELTVLSPEDQRAVLEKLRRPLPFRAMASAHPSILDGVRYGKFDEETFRALSKVRIQIPPLRFRRADIPLLIDHFLKRSCERFQLKPLGIPSS
ncbi:MAG: sigma 54-interacting transcriptional regulator, partial [Vicinamibacteria bacterium]